MLLIKFLSIYLCFEMLSSRCPAQGVPDTEGKPVNVNVKGIFGSRICQGDPACFLFPLCRRAGRLFQPSPSGQTRQHLDSLKQRDFESNFYLGI